MKIRDWVRGYSVRMLAAMVFALMVLGSANGGLREEYGDGLWHDIGSGWQYRYVSSIDSGYWRFSGVVRFGFDYDPGQWWHQGTTWTTLSGIGLSEGDWVGDGSWHNLNNNGWSYRYLTSIASGYWNNGGTSRFGYHYSVGQWWDNWNGWAKLGALGLSQAFIGDGEFHDLNNGWSYKYVASASSSYWNNGGTSRFGYDYSVGQWWDNWNGWAKLGALGLSQAFVGDGEFHDLNNGWLYKYVTSASSSYWNNGGTSRFGYDYSVGQWWDNWNGWAKLGASGLSQAFIGDGDFHDLNNGWSYKYVASASSSYWNNGSVTRLGYHYGAGQWWDNRNGWAKLGPSEVSQVFIGDGIYHNLNNGWRYKYDKGLDRAYWETGGAERFCYHYDNGQWWDWGISWYELSAEGVSQTFIGDGSLHDLFNGFSYRYDDGLSIGFWLLGGANRFHYVYRDGQWFDYGSDGVDWKLSETGKSARFLGAYTSTDRLDLGNGLSYWYVEAEDYGRWYSGDAFRFGYQYADGTWSHQGADGTPWQLCHTDSARFLGSYIDTDRLNLGNGFEYWYNSSTGIGYWWRTGAGKRFHYVYGDGQWFHYGPATIETAGRQLSGIGRSARFLGSYTDTDRLNLGNGFEYWYNSSSGTGYWWSGAGKRFHYAYDSGEWYHYGPTDTIGQRLSGIYTSARFLGEYTKGSPLYILYGCYYWYDPSSGIGYLSTSSGANQRFHYVYGDGQWFHYGPTDTAGQKLSETGRSARLVVSYNYQTDSRDLGNGFQYWYGSSLHEGYWATGVANRFSYAYGAGQWSIYQAIPSPNWKTLGTTGVSAAFIGDPGSHTLGSSYYWKVQYDAGSSILNFYVWSDNDSTERNYLRYNFTEGVWQDRNAGYTWTNVAGYYLVSDGQNVVSLRKSDYSWRMDLMFGASHYNMREIVALYWENGTIPYAYHDYVECGWYFNDNYPSMDPLWTLYESGATDLWKPPR